MPPSQVHPTREFTLPVTVELHTADLNAERWPTYRPRRAVVARRLAAPTTVNGRMYADGYLVRDAAGHVVVMGVQDFEAVYELAGLTD